jgi:hypothetical protein
MRLKFKRPSLPREVWVPGPWVVTALLMVLIGATSVLSRFLEVYH